MRAMLTAGLSTLFLGAVLASEAAKPLGQTGEAPANAVTTASYIVTSVGIDQGLCLVVNDSDGKLTAALVKASRLYVQGCMWDDKGVPAARKTLVDAGVADRGSIAWLEADYLPYADDLINLVACATWGAKPVAIEEVLRVMAPGGTALLGNDANPGAISGLEERLKQAGVKEIKISGRKGWIQFVKPVNADVDSWPHNLGGPDLSYVNNDKVVGPWEGVRWIGDPRWGAHYLTYYARVTAGGRLYYEEGRAAVGGTQTWLAARDAWNGCELWRLPIGPVWRDKGGMKQQWEDDTLTCDENAVYCVEAKTLTARDGRTGKKLREFAPGFVPRIVTSAGPALLASDIQVYFVVAGRAAALDKESGKILWSRPCIAPPPVENGTAFVLTAAELEGVEMATGASRWKVKAEGIPGYARAFCKAGVVYVTYAPPWKPIGLLAAYDAKAGALLWKKDALADNVGMFPYPDELWLMQYQPQDKSKRAVRVFDPRTGANKREFALQDSVFPHCFSSKGTARCLLFNDSWYLDLKSGKATGLRTARGPCNLGQMPANGLTYYLPQHCDCNVTIRGMLAMSGPEGRSWLPDAAREGRPQRFTSGSAPVAIPERADDWPMYRRDMARSNFTPAKLPEKLGAIWSEKLGGSPLTQAVSAYGVVCVAEPETHRVFARDAATGKAVWSFVADGRVDVPPGLHKGLCLFGTGAGSVYALDARTGKEVWRLRAAPVEKYIADRGQFASAWPVIGGVMPMNGEVFFACGRSQSVDGGMWLFAADAATGNVRWRVRGGSCGDLFTSDGKELMRTRTFYQLANGAQSAGGKESRGLLRTTHYFTKVSVMDYMASVDPFLTSKKHVDLTDGRGVTGENLAFSDTLGVAAWRYRFGVPKEMMKEKKGNQRFIYAVADGKNKWLLDEDVSQQMVGVVLAGDTAYMAGVPVSLDPKENGELWVISGADGKKLQTLTLDARPVYDGLSAAGGRLYMTTDDGRLFAFGHEK